MNTDQLKQKRFEEICYIYNDDLQRFIYSLTRKDQFDMEEIFQNTLLEAFKGLDSLEDIDKMKTWVYSIAMVESKRYYYKKRNLIPTVNVPFDDVENMISEDNPNDFTRAVEDKQLTRSLLRRLPNDEQQIFILYYFYGIPFKTMSDIFGVNYNTLTSIHTRGIAKFQKILKQEGGFY